MTEKKAILMCAGAYEPMEIPVRPGDLVVAVDAGLSRLLAQGIAPDLVLGDFDSLEKKYAPYLEALERKHPEKLLRLPCEKDDTDTVYAAKVCLERGYRKIIIYGALGGRLDHTIANIQTLAFLREQGVFGYMLEKRPDKGVWRTTLVSVLRGERVLLPGEFEGTFSLFALDSCLKGVTLEGMKYPLHDAELTNAFPLGVSNEVSRAPENRAASVQVREGLALMILDSEQGERVLSPSKIERRTL
ncbi:MAG: thiamine diphosphokinase [Eubacteriales bacterium]|nr:thiamine diphosphokinase [Eubacteriales bacterium]